MGEDQGFNLLCIPRAKRIATISDVLYYYRLDNNNSLCHSHNSNFVAQQHCKIAQLVYDDWENQGWLSSNVNSVINFLNWFYRCMYISEYSSYYDKTLKSIDDLIKLKKLNSLTSGIYEISSALNNNKVLDIDGGSTDSGANLHLWEENNSNAQKFEIKYEGFGCYTIKAVCSGKMLDIVNAGSQNGTNIQQYDKNNTDAQKWYIVPLNDGYYSIISKCNGLYMDVSGAMTTNGTNIHCWNDNSSKAQKFKFIKNG